MTYYLIPFPKDKNLCIKIGATLQKLGYRFFDCPRPGDLFRSNICDSYMLQRTNLSDIKRIQQTTSITFTECKFKVNNITIF